MSTISEMPDGYPPEITGYAEPWIVSPGDTVELKVSCTEPEYTYRVVRTIQGIEMEHSPKPTAELVEAIPEGKGTGRFQLARPGSYAVVDDWASASQPLDNIEVSFYAQPWLPTAGHAQALISTFDVVRSTGFAVIITKNGQLELWIGTGAQIETLTTDVCLVKRRWLHIKLQINGAEIILCAEPLAHFATPAAPSYSVKKELKSGAMKLSHESPLLFGACFADSAETPSSSATNFFNGRLDSPMIKNGATFTTLVKFDFSRSISSDKIIDVSSNHRDGRLINAPTRAVKSFDWDGTENNYTIAKYGYGAIHFHEDDLDDACWDTDFSVTIPKDVRSGAYAVEIESTNAKAKDSITFFVRPSKEAWSKRKGKIAFVLSTFTYLAYANEHLWDSTRESSIDIGPGFDMSTIARSEDFEKLQRRRDFGLSPYDHHVDGSGVIYSSSKRPILNLRASYIMWAMRRPREYSADTIFIGFLEREGIPYEIVTDHDLHEKGVAAINGFNTVVSGHHPEYQTLQSLDAWTAYAKQGGNIMYLGGNGFYWVTAADLATRSHRMEIRRGDQGVRSFTFPGGERINNLDGQHGGLWRSRGRPCNILFGIGFSGEGAGPGVPYKRSQLSKSDASVAWLFEDMGDELIGVHGFGGGASGDEIDRYDPKNDSPECVKVVASSTGHPDDFGLAPEDAHFPIMNTLGTQTDRIRSDITYYVNSGGGGVFSVGSMNWFSSLGWDDYDNNVAKLTGNVLKGFLKGLV